jgi:hypothetical protein
MYTLILTLFVYGTQAPTISHVEGFKSDVACRDAGDKWAFEMVKTFGASTKMSAVCVLK